MTRKTPPPAWLIKAANDRLYLAAAAHEIPLGHLVNHRRKTRAIVAARRDAIHWLRSNVVNRTVNGDIELLFPETAVSQR